MKTKLILATTTFMYALPALAGKGQVPEPSTLGLFAAAALAITVVYRLKK